MVKHSQQPEAQPRGPGGGGGGGRPLQSKSYARDQKLKFKPYAKRRLCIFFLKKIACLHKNMENCGLPYIELEILLPFYKINMTGFKFSRVCLICCGMTRHIYILARILFCIHKTLCTATGLLGSPAQSSSGSSFLHHFGQTRSCHYLSKYSINIKYAIPACAVGEWFEPRAE